MHMIQKKKYIAVIITTMLISFIPPVPIKADSDTIIKTKENQSVDAVGQYKNWDGVSNVAQFIDNEGNFCFAYDGTTYVTIVKTKNGTPINKKIKLRKLHPIFGDIDCDSKGNFYLVTGETNETEDTSVDTVFISKYDKNGKRIKTVGDNGSSSLASYYEDTFYTKIPFDGGSCDIAINGDYLSVNYARQMYSGHQSNSVFTINTLAMTKIDLGLIYNSHSFAQRAVPFGDGFVFASEGDCYSRAFTISLSNPNTSMTKDSDIFHFWVKKDTLTQWDMYTLNNNFAHMGGLATVNDNLIAFVGTSVSSLNSNAANEPERLFIQLFNPQNDLSQASSYVTQGTRSGVSGPNGDQKVTDYGIRWLTTNGTGTTVSNPQVVSDGNGKIVVLYEKYVDHQYKGVYYCILNEKGRLIKKTTLFSKTARLNPCRMPVYANDSIYWSGNKYNDSTDTIYVYKLML